VAGPLAASPAFADARAHFNIPPQALESALYQFADQAHASLALPEAGVGAAQSAGASGALTAEAALQQLLEGSGYVYQKVGADAFRIIAAQRPIHASTEVPPEDIVVTAGRRPTPLNTLPRSVSHLSADDLRDIGAHDLNDVILSVNGFSRTNTGLGRDKMLLRGISDGALTGISQSTVGLYLNGLRLTYAAPDPDLELVDIRDVDVLRGPQGALYGAGSIGGIVQIETNPVDLSNSSLDAKMEGNAVEYGRTGSNVAAVANAPIVSGKFGVRGVAYSQQFGGWLDNNVTGMKDTNSAERRGARLTTTFDGGFWDASLFGVYQTLDSHDAQYIRLADDDVRSAHMLEPHDNDFLSVGVALHASLPLGELTSTTASVRHQITSRYDATGGFADLGVDPLQVKPFDEDQNLDIIIHETRLTSPANASIPWLVGVFYADGDNRRENTLRYGAPGIWNSVAYSEGRTDGIDEEAVFGEINWPLAPHLSLSTGVRLFRFRVKTQSTTHEELLATSNTFKGSLLSDGVAPDVRLAYQPNPDMLFYLSIARGYRGGGFNTGGPAGAITMIGQPNQRFSGDSLVATELGTRLSLFEQRLSLSAGIFYYRWHHIQSDSLIVDGFPYTGNVGDGDAYGFETELRYAVGGGLTLLGNLLINEPELKHPDPTYPGILNRDFPGAPEHSLAIGLRYERRLDWARNLSFFGEADAGYISQAFVGYDTLSTIGDYGVANTRVGLRTPDWDLALFVDNITAADDRTFGAGNPYGAAGGPYVSPPTPRTIGVSLSHSF
jgi:outer membrane receptor protein involved in Fe transport